LFNCFAWVDAHVNCWLLPIISQCYYMSSVRLALVKQSHSPAQLYKERIGRLLLDFRLLRCLQVELAVQKHCWLHQKWWLATSRYRNAQTSCVQLQLEQGLVVGG
jgi:hypothetical protein